MRHLQKTAVGMAIVVLFSANAVAENRYVSTSGVDAGACSAPLSPCATIQYALDVPAPSQTEVHIRIAKGTYIESVTIPTVFTLVHLQGGWDDGFTALVLDAYSTVVQSASPSSPAVAITYSNDLTGFSVSLEGMLITGGSIGVRASFGNGGSQAHLLQIQECVLTGNLLGSSIGVGGFTHADIEISNSLVVNNVGEGGILAGASYYGFGDMTILNSTIASNSGVGTGGLRMAVNSWIHEPGFFDVDIINSVIWGNSSSEGGDDIWNFVGNPSFPGCAHMTVSDSNIGEVVSWERDGDPDCYIEGPGMLSTDPVFADASIDHHLDLSSPSVDAGSNAAAAALTMDFEGDTRILDGDNNGDAIVDMGADEVNDFPSAWWPANGTAADVSGNGNDGSLNGGMGFGAGLSGQGFIFDGLDDVVSVPHDPSLNIGEEDFSIDLKLRTGQSAGCWPALIDKRSGASQEAGFIVYLANGKPGIQLRDSQAWFNFTCNNAFVSDELFHRLAITVDRDSPTGLVFAVDGKKACEFDPTVMPQSLDNGEEVWIGKSHDSLSPCFYRGLIEDVALWPKTLSARRSADALGGLTAWWPVDSDTSDAIGLNHGTAQGATFVPGRNGMALQLDGIEGVVEVPDNSSIDFGGGDFSIAFWIRTSQASGCWPAVFQKRDSRAGYLVFLSNGRPGLQLVDDLGWENFVSPVSIADGSFHSVVISVDRDSSNGGLVFIDGQSVFSFDPTSVTGSLNNNADLWIGKSLAVNPCHLDGAVDEMMFFGRVLSEQEVSYLAMATSPVIFLDGFESGSTILWSSVAP